MLRSSRSATAERSVPWRLRPSRNRRRVCLAAAAGSLAVAGVAALVATSGTTPASHTQRQPLAGRWTRVFYDHFTGPASRGPGRQWGYVTTATFGGQIATMTRSRDNVHLTGHGGLDITALGRGLTWTSADIQSTTQVAAPAGGELEVVADIRQPDPAGSLGYWPAFWLLGPGQWPESGEIDVMEDVNAASGHSAHLHCGTASGGPCQEPGGLGTTLQACAGCRQGFHTYSVLIDRTDPGAESVTWYLDGSAFFRVGEGQVGASAWRAAVDHGFAILLDVAMGGSYPDSNCACSTPASTTSSGGTMTVKYVAAYRKGG